MPIHVLGKGSVAGVLRTIVSVIAYLMWAMLLFCIIFLGIPLLLHAIGADMKIPGILDVNIGFEDKQFKDVTLGFLTAIVVFVGAILMTGQLKAILTTLEAKDPFVPENAKRLLNLAYILAGIEISRILISLMAKFLQFYPDINVTSVVLSSLASWAAVVTLWILSQVFAEGTRLREEEKMTI